MHGGWREEPADMCERSDRFSGMGPTSPDRRAAPGRALIVFLSTALVSVSALAWVGWTRAGKRSADGMPALSDDAVRRGVVEGLVAESAGIWDSFADPDVGRVLQPGLDERESGQIRVSSNSRGVREREWAVPKPAGRFRVVVLGDSFVFGNGVAPEDRLGSFLEAALAERGDADVEVLSIGMSAWNLAAECAWARRSLSDLEPDLLVHVSVSNDLDDNPGVRGFGSLAHFGTARRERANGFVTTSHPYTLGVQADSWLEAGLDWESRSRYEAAAADVLELAEAVEAAGGRYLALFYWFEALPIAARVFEPRLGPERCAYVPSAFHHEMEYRVSKIDWHWNRAGHDLVARMVYGLVRARGLAPFELEPWDAADAAVRELHAAGQAEASGDPAGCGLLAGRRARARIDFDALDPASASQIHGGVDRHGQVAPYGSLLLARTPEATHLHLVGEHLARPELRGTVEVWLDDVRVARLAQEAGARVDERFPIPAALSERDHLSVRFVIDDWAYDPERLGECVGFRLRSVEATP